MTRARGSQLTISFTVPGVPAPQGSPKIVRRGGGKAGLAIDSPKLKAWRTNAKYHASAAARMQGKYKRQNFEAHDDVSRQQHRKVIYDRPVMVRAKFFMPKVKRPLFDIPAVKPDLDKLCRAIGDVLENANIVSNDSRIVEWHASKHYSDTPRAEITVSAYEED